MLDLEQTAEESNTYYSTVHQETWLANLAKYR